MRAFISIGVFLPMVWITVEVLSLLKCHLTDEDKGQVRILLGEFLGHGILSFGSRQLVTEGVNISLVDPTILVSNTETYWSNVAWVSPFDLDLKMPPQPSLTLGLVQSFWPCPLQSHCCHD